MVAGMDKRAKVIRAVEQMLGNSGDNLARAKLSFRQYSHQGMQEQHGQSGSSRQEVLDGYQKEYDEWVAVLAYAKENLK